VKSRLGSSRDSARMAATVSAAVAAFKELEGSATKKLENVHPIIDWQFPGNFPKDTDSEDLDRLQSETS